MPPESQVSEIFRIATREQGGDPHRLHRYAARLFEAVPLQDRRMLDIGGGGGLYSFYAALMGASVHCLEPASAGSNTKYLALFEQLTEAFPHAPVVLDSRSLQNLRAQSAEYDVLLMHNSINHLDEQAAKCVHRDKTAARTYLGLFERLAKLARPGADLLASDCSRYNLFGVLGMQSPFAPDIEWDIHQQPSTWVTLLERSGFRMADIRWNSMSRTGRIGELTLANWLGAFLTTSHFTIHMRFDGNAQPVAIGRGA